MTLVKNGTLAATTVGGGGGSALSPAVAACPKGAAIVGFAYSTEINSGYAYSAGAFSGLRSIGACPLRFCTRISAQSAHRASGTPS